LGSRNGRYRTFASQKLPVWKPPASCRSRFMPTPKFIGRSFIASLFQPSLAMQDFACFPDRWPGRTAPAL
jgi:hypothetical protein